MIQIRRIKPDEWTAAKRVVYRAAYPLFARGRDLESFIAQHEAIHELKDMDEIDNTYFGQSGTFLVMLENDNIICTGAIRHLKENICELRRLWLLPEYHKQGLGYKMVQELIAFARRKGYERIWLETDPSTQVRALVFYKQLGFREIDKYTNRDDSIAMELTL